MQRYTHYLSVLRTSAVAGVFAAAATFGAHAQVTATAGAVQPASLFAPQPSAMLMAANDMPDASSLSYSSSAGAAESAAATSFSLEAPDAAQPPPRRYGRRPVYADSSHNADGSNKYSFFGGVGLTLPTGGTHNDLATSYSFQVGGGRNFNKNFGVMAQFDWDNFGFQGSTLNNQIQLYNSLGAGLSSLNGTSHIWSFTLDPIYNFWQADKYGAYVVGGVGFYHKTATFTTPGIGEYCDPYYGCYQYQANQPIDSYTSNAVGFNGGLGLTYKPSHFGNERLYAEARYVFVDNSQRPFDVSGNTPYFNAFPQNSAKTTYIPIKFGIRF